MKKIALITIFSLTVCGLMAQENNLQNYTPSILFGKGDFEFKTFQNYYTQTRSFETASSKGPAGQRQHFFTSINQFLYGLNSQINVGFDVWYRSTGLPLQGFMDVDGDLIFERNGELRVRQSGVSLVGPKIKIAPFKKLSRLSIQSTYLFQTINDQENRLPESNRNGFFFTHDRSIWLTQFFYDKPFSDKFQLFFQQAFWYSNVRDSFRQNNYLETQTSVFFSYFADSRWTIYGMTEYFPTHYNDAEQRAEFASNWFVQSGVGLKYQLVPGLIETELLYTNFWLGSVGNGAGQTFNLGVRVINQK